MDARRRRERTRLSYMPGELRVLFIGESPPTGGTFFYDTTSILYRATRKAFVTATPKLGDDADFLRAFQRMGCYLEDLSLAGLSGSAGRFCPDPQCWRGISASGTV